jgi:PIN domain nuclease of toxin-antitoxin system
VILLDTHAWIWWTDIPDKLGDGAHRRIEKASRIGVHVISCFEIAILVEKKKITLDLPVDEWVSKSFRHPKIDLVPLSVPAAIQCTQFPGGFHQDPVDRILSATCLINDYPMVTKDRLIEEWGHIETIW